MAVSSTTLSRRTLVVALLAGSALGGCIDADRRPSVVVVLVDSLRQDHLPVYGYERETSPAMERLAARGWVFDRHLSHASHTVPATLSMMVSLYPVEHGVVHRAYGQFVEAPPMFPDQLDFLSEAFQRAGYRTAAFIANPHLRADSGFDQGFERFIYRPKDDGERLTRAAAGWIRQRAAGGEAFFAYLHLMDAHIPYRAKPEYASRYAPATGGTLLTDYGPADGTRPEDLEYTIAMYDACINYVDDQVALLVQMLDELAIFDDTIVVVTSDHGDEFLEHGGLGHGTTVYGELVRIPLIVSYPPKLAAGRRATYLTRHIDLGPTLLELAGLPVPESFRGSSLLSPAPEGFAENGPWRAIHAGDESLVVNRESGTSELFHVSDPLDQRPRDGADASAQLHELLARYLELEAARGTADGPATGRSWTDDELQLLRSLGYIR